MTDSLGCHQVRELACATSPACALSRTTAGLASQATFRRPPLTARPQQAGRTPEKSQDVPGGHC